MMKFKLKSLSRNKLHRKSWPTLSLPRSVFKVVVLGAGGVGKTSLIQRFVMDEFPQYYNPTVEESYEKSISLSKGFGAFFEITDTAGAYRFPAMKRLTIERGDAFLLVYSLTDDDSIQEVLRLRKEIINVKGTNEVPIIIVGNKTDCVSEDRIQSVRQRLWRLVSSHTLVRSETSAKYNINVSGVFGALLGQIAVVNSERIGGIPKSMTL